MLTAPQIDPIAIQLGPLAIRWYGLMYLIAFLAFWWLGRRRARQTGLLQAQQVDDLLFYGALGVILGGRLGYVFFYGFEQLLADPLYLVRIWQGGMSFHGGLLGVLVAAWLFGRKHGLGFFGVTDFIAPLVPLGLGAGRVGNFINGELWGRVSDAPWAMVFAHAGPLPRHPSQLYEAFLEGLVLFLLLWFYSAKPRPRMAVSGLFLVGYGAARTAVEFAREPDAHLGYLAGGWLTMGMLLSVPMVLVGAVLMGLAYRGQNDKASG
ncbi:MAG: prolipoprotein diacylglyceryl transferase [Gammaproteobacteria bacterium]|jgi:phosphatidylglycerol:prolipoprotein diacylglycerol transferase|nr:prolipoprotein diacylglyceryl transferase [Gammaproteobacteria bacterium]